MRLSGWHNQETGDVGQALVTAELARGGFTVGSLAPDLGEDLWAEMDGRQATAEGNLPLRALFQVKATESDATECVLDIELDQLKRWAAQPLPVLVVGVSTTTGQFFAKSVDEIVAKHFSGQDLFDLRTKTARIRLDATADLAGTVRLSVERHYESLRLNLVDIPEDEINANYFEVLQRRDPHSFGLPVMGWFVLWKSPPRPQHFAAMIGELTRRAKTESQRTRPRPALFIFHIYRSIEDRHHNLAVARVDVVNPDHPKSVTLREVMGISESYRVRAGGDVKPFRDFMRSKTATAQDFRRYALQIGPAFDALADKVIARGASGAQVWDDELDREFSRVDDNWNNGPFAPSECRALEGVFTEYYGSLLTHHHVALRRAKELPREVTHRLLREEERRLASFRRAWDAVLQAERRL